MPRLQLSVSDLRLIHVCLHNHAQQIEEWQQQPPISEADPERYTKILKQLKAIQRQIKATGVNV